ncbi:MAG: DNA topoisomerase VI subunit B [Candidatus Thermoplasmatota archaeon]|nr:DNA topoisomerase VI subunit B [Candidatus Thermoplasmatota archaeon]
MSSRKIDSPSEFRETSISEFFEKNRHILGFDSLQKSLFMVIKEAVDNSLDACEEYQILPDIYVEISRSGDDILTAVIEDNGPGISRKEVPNVFGRLLYGSRFGTLRQSRGQQGIGITASILYGQITTALPSKIRTKMRQDDVAYDFQLGINVKENRADIISEKPVIWEKESGTRIEIPLKGKYQTGKQSVFEYLKESAIVNPNAQFTFIDPEGKKVRIERVVEKASVPARSIKPHPMGLELGELFRMARAVPNRTLGEFLLQDLSRVTPRTLDDMTSAFGIDFSIPVENLEIQYMKGVMDAFSSVKILPPPTDCLSPLGSDFIRRGLKNIYGELQPLYFGKPVQRPVSVHNGNPFSVEVGIVYGGNLPAEEQVRIVRFANKVPLLYQPGACAITRAISEMDWRTYGFDQRGGKGVPFGPAIILVHVFGIRLPFTSESKEAIAGIDIIVDEIMAALKTAARGVRGFINKREKRSKIYEKFTLVEKIIPEIGSKSASLLGLPQPDISMVLSRIANVIFVTESFQRNEDHYDVKAEVVNFTRKTATFKLYAEPPGVSSPSETLSFDVSGLEPSRRISFEFRVNGTFNQYPGTEYYFTGIDPVWVQGAELLPPDYFEEELKIEAETDE